MFVIGSVNFDFDTKGVESKLDNIDRTLGKNNKLQSESNDIQREHQQDAKTHYDNEKLARILEQNKALGGTLLDDHEVEMVTDMMRANMGLRTRAMQKEVKELLEKYEEIAKEFKDYFSIFVNRVFMMELKRYDHMDRPSREKYYECSKCGVPERDYSREIKSGLCENCSTELATFIFNELGFIPKDSWKQ